MPTNTSEFRYSQVTNINEMSLDYMIKKYKKGNLEWRNWDIGEEV